MEEETKLTVCKHFSEFVFSVLAKRDRLEAGCVVTLSFLSSCRCSSLYEEDNWPKR